MYAWAGKWTVRQVIESTFLGTQTPQAAHIQEGDDNIW